MTSAAEPGATLSHYRLGEKLGAGRMGVVFRARDLVLERDVALKLLPPDLVADEAVRADLLREARTASVLNHPNICVVHEVGEDGGQVFVAMELVEGEPLQRLIPRDGLPDETVVRYAAPLARALAHAHSRHVVHRDVKTANVVVGPGGQPKLLDFGLSRRVLEESAHGATGTTSTGVVAGTPSYLAPELLHGGRASVASDVWALGVVLYEMCSGRHPFAGPHVASVVTAILHAQPEPLPAHTSPALQSVVARCLAKDPRQRYAGAGEIAAALEALLPGTSVARPRRPGRRRVWVAAAAVALVGVTVLALDMGGVRGWITAGDRHAIRSIAVLPLENRPRDPAQDYFSDGMTEQLIADLAQVRGLRVISRTSIMKFKDTHASLAEIAEALGVDAVVEGSVQQQGGQVRIQARLVDARTEQQLWSGQFDRPLRDVLALQSAVAQDVTDQIRKRLTGAERARLAHSDEVDPAAFDHYLRGRYALSHGQAAAAIAEFRSAIAADPRYARAYAGLAHGFVRAHVLGDSTAEAVEEPALAAATRSVELDATSAETWLALADVQGTLAWDLDGAERSARRALEFGPGDAEAHHTYALVIGARGRLGECVTEMRRARESDPLSAYYQQQLGDVLVYARRYDEAAAELGKTLALYPDWTAARRDLGWALLEKGEFARAIQELERVKPTPALLACAYARSGRTSEARRILLEFEARGREGRAQASDIAQICAALGEKDRAFHWLELSWQRREQGFLTLPFDPELDPLRSDPRYATLVGRAPAPRAAGPAAGRTPPA